MMLNKLRQGIEQRNRHQVIQRPDSKFKSRFRRIPHGTEFTPRGIKLSTQPIGGDAGGLAFESGLDLVDWRNITGLHTPIDHATVLFSECLCTNSELDALLELQNPDKARRSIGEHGQPLCFEVERSNSPLPLSGLHTAVSLPAKLKKLAKCKGCLGRVKAA